MNKKRKASPKLTEREKPLSKPMYSNQKKEIEVPSRSIEDGTFLSTADLPKNRQSR